MPEVHFHVRWPDGSVTRCYSPSRVVLDYFREGAEMTVREFADQSSAALDRASQRVEDRFGYRCSSASAQRERILELAQGYDDAQTAKIVRIEIDGKEDARE